MTMEPQNPDSSGQGQQSQGKTVNSPKEKQSPTSSKEQKSPPKLPSPPLRATNNNNNNNNNNNKSGKSQHQVPPSPSRSRSSSSGSNSSHGRSGGVVARQPSPSLGRSTPQIRQPITPWSAGHHGSLQDLKHKPRHQSVPAGFPYLHKHHPHHHHNVLHLQQPSSLHNSNHHNHHHHLIRSNTLPHGRHGNGGYHKVNGVDPQGGLGPSGLASSSADDNRCTPPPSPLPKQKSAHSSPSLSLKNNRNGKKSGSMRSHSSKSDSSHSSDDEKCLPQVESIMRQMASGKVTTDSLVNNFGGCGPFQVLLVMATYSAQIAAVWGMMFMAFGNYHPKWWCYDKQEAALKAAAAQAAARAANASIAAAQATIEQPLFTNLTSLLDPAGGDGSMSKDDDGHGGGSSAFISPAAGGVWSMRANQTGTCSIYKKCQHVKFDSRTSTAASEWNLICDEMWAQSAIISIQMTGVLVGACLGGFIGDRRGRKITLYGHLFFLAVFNFLIILSPSWQVFTFFRFLIGACVGGILACCILYPVEFVDVWWRGVLGALPVWNVGAASFSVAVWLLKDWKQLHIATAVLSCLIFLPVFWVPESMRWLAVNGRVEDAKFIANMIASMNRRPPPNTTVLEIIAKEEKRMSRLKGTYSKYTVLDLFADRFIRRISFRMGFIWCCMSACYYALSFGIKNFSGDFYINFILFSAAEVPGMFFVAPATNKLGRRLGSVVYFVSCAACCACVVVVSFAASGGVRGTVITVLAMFAKMHILAVWMMVTVYSTELYPTVIRNLSAGYLNACGRLGGIAAPFLLPNSSDFLFVSFIIMGCLMIICCYLVKTLPETKGRPLEDTIKARSHLSIIVEETEFELRISESA